MIRLTLTIGDGRMVIRGLTGEQASRLVAELSPGSYTLTCERLKGCAKRPIASVSTDVVRRLATR